jgi:hypothetical protein
VAATPEIVAVGEIYGDDQVDTAAPVLLAVTVLPRRWRGRR